MPLLCFLFSRRVLLGGSRRPCVQVMLLPESTPEADIIMVATGTGIAPYRAFWKRLFVEQTPAAENFKVV